MTTTMNPIKVHEGDVVEFLEDLPEYGFSKNQRGVVVTKFEHPTEAYDVEVVNEHGDFAGFAYSVKPEQIRNVSGHAYTRGIELLREGKLAEATVNLKIAAKLAPDYLYRFHEGIRKTYEGADNLIKLIGALQIVIRIEPTYQEGREHLSISYMNYGVQVGNKGDTITAIELFYRALCQNPNEQTKSFIRQNLSTAYTVLGMKAEKEGDFAKAYEYMGQACALNPNEQTRLNLGKAYALLARFFLERKEYQSARVYFESAIEADLFSSGLYNDYGVVLAVLDNFSDAERAFERALQLEPNNEMVLENLACLAAKEEKVAEGLHTANLIIEFEPAPPMRQYQMAA